MLKKSSILIASAIFAGPAYADHHAATELDNIVITATKTPKSIDKVSASVEVVTAAEIEKTGAATLKDVLAKMPSIQAQYARFPHPSSKSKASVSIRGAGANETLFLIDGKRLSAETENPYEMTRIPTSMIERIEVVKGSMSSLYGSDAIGGVINIITKKTDKPITSIDVKYGQNGAGEGKEKSINFMTIGKQDKTGYKLYASNIAGTPYTVNETKIESGARTNTNNLDVSYIDDSTVSTVGFGVEHELSSRTTLAVDASYLVEDRSGNYFGNAALQGLGLVINTPINSEDRNNRKDLALTVDHTTENETDINFKVYRSAYEKRNETTPLAGTGPVNTKFSANVTITGIEGNATLFANDANLITVGAELRDETRDSSAINPVPSSSDFKQVVTTYKSAFIQDEIELSDSLNAILGARYDSIHVSKFDGTSQGKSKATAKVGLVKNLSNGLNARVNFAQGFRAPDVAELYVVAPYYKGKQRLGADVIFGAKGASYDLQPESSQTLEVAIAKRSGKFQGEAVLFKTEVEDKIALKEYATYFTSENLKKVEITGAEFSAEYDASAKLDVGFNATVLTTTNQETNKELTYTPNLSAALSANYAVTPKLDSSFIIRYFGDQFTDELNTQTAGGYSVADLSLNYQMKDKVKVYGGINNLADTQIPEQLGATAGRFFFAGVKADF